MRLALDRSGDAGVAIVVAVMLRRKARAHARGGDFARDRRGLADMAAVIVPHQIDVDVIVVIDVGARRQHGGELVAGGRLYVVQKALLLGRTLPAILNADLVTVG